MEEVTQKQRKTKEIDASEDLAWTAPSRLFKRRDKEYLMNVAAIVFLLCLILVFAREFVLVAAVLAVVFVVYVLSTVPPEGVSNKITSLGIQNGNHFYRWEELLEFWFEDQWGQVLLVVKPYAGTRIILLLGSQSRESVRDRVSAYIPYREIPEKTWVDNAATWLTNKIPLEKPA